MKIKDINQLNSLLDNQSLRAVATTQRLRPINRGYPQVIKPPTYRGEDDSRGKTDEGQNVYAVWKEPDGRLGVLLDKVASQANRVEPMFKKPRYRDLSPKVTVKVGEQEHDILDVTHRLGDASIRNSDAWDEISEMLRSNDLVALARNFPVSVVLGFWDSRGTTGVKFRRLWRSEISAYGVTVVRTGVTVHPTFNYDDVEDQVGSKRSSGINPMQSRGMKPYSDLTGNPGGVEVREDTVIHRTSSISLNRLQAIVETARESGNSELEKAVRYLFSLCLVMDTMPLQGDLREGCELVAKDPAETMLVNGVTGESGDEPLELDHDTAIEFCKRCADDLGLAPSRVITFNLDKAVAEVKKNGDSASKDSE